MSVSGRTESAITTSTSFWFDDGNLVLEVEDTRFRVHRSILSHHSSFFKDLSLIPQPVDSKEVTEDGTPILKIPFDSKEDWESMLYVIYNPLESHISSREYSLQILMTVLRLSHKYQFKRFEELARDGVKQFIPLDYEEWMESDFSRQAGRMFDELQGNEFKLLKLVKEVGGMEEYYPTLYLLCIWGVTDTTVFLDLSDRTKDGVELDRDEIMTLIRGRERFLEASLRHWTEALDLYLCGGSCNTKGGCAKIKRDFLSEMLELVPRLDPKDSALGTSLTNLKDYKTLCYYCKDRVSRSQSEASEVLWKGLHIFFGLPDFRAPGIMRVPAIDDE